MKNEERCRHIDVCKKLCHFFHYHNISNDEFICAICGKQPIEKHHENYNLWNVFIPLCHKHHMLTIDKMSKRKTCSKDLYSSNDIRYSKE